MDEGGIYVPVLKTRKGHLVHIVIRTDASLEIGTGHVMRCITIADELTKKGSKVEFICRKHVGHLGSLILSKNYQVNILDAPRKNFEEITPDKASGESILSHSHWLGVSQAQDANDCYPILEAIDPDWLIVDHYGIDHSWQMSLRGVYKQLMVIDDLADRYHQCDLLLDQTYGRQIKNYQNLVPSHCNLKLGSKYALLRTEFSQMRDYSLKGRIKPRFKKLLISMGGVDSENVTGQVLDVLGKCDLPEDLEICIVMGATSPFLDQVTHRAKYLPYKIEVKNNVNNMAEIMASMDLAIGAAGTTTWERCCLGLPSILMVLADNQKNIAESMSKNNMAIVVDIRLLEKLCEVVSVAKNKLKDLSINSASVTDGKGVERIVACML